MKTSLKTTKTIIALSVCAASFEQQANDWETITVTGNRIEQSVGDSLSTTKVIERADIEVLNPKSLTELLSTVAGFDFSQQGGRGQNSSLFSRGTNSNHTLVLVDGIRISSATTGGADLQIISPAQIERIEIVKGPRAAIWGSDAIGGVIQIFTRKGEGLSASMGIGSDGYQQATATFGFEHGDGASSISINSEQSDGFSVLNQEGADPDADGYEHVSLTATGHQEISEQFELNYLLQINKADNEYDPSPTWGGNDQVEKENHVWSVGGNYVLTEANSINFKFGQAQDSSLNSGTPYEDLYETVRDQASIVSSNALSSEFHVTAGADLISEQITTTTKYPTDSRDVLGLFGHGQYQYNDYKFELAVRHDDADGIDAETTYHLGVGYDLSKFSNLAFSHGTGFKTPTFNDLYSPFGGNAELKSETSSTSEFIYKHNFLSAVAQASLYHTEVNNLIAWAPQDNGSWQPDNVAEATIQGAEVDVRVNYLGFEHNASLAYIDTEDDATGEQLIRRAKEHINYSISGELEAISFTASYLYKGSRMDTGAEKLKAYSLVNLALGYELTSQWQLKLKVNNLLDKEYVTAKGYNTKGINWYLGVTYQ